MSNLPPSTEPAPEPDSGVSGPDGDSDGGVVRVQPEPPRTVRRRAARPPVAPLARPSQATAASPVPAEEIEGADDAAAAEGEPEGLAKPEAVADPEVGVEPEASAESESGAEPEVAVENAPVAQEAAEPEVITEPTPEPEPEAAAEPAAQAPRTGRIEIPVPSVVRARERGALAAQNPVVLRTEQLTKSYGQVLAAADVSLAVHAGSFTGIVGPNGAGKTTVLSMISGLNRPTSGRVTVHEIDVWADGPAAKRVIGTLPDRLRLFDRLSGAQLLYYAGVLHGVDESAVAARASELARAFGLESALDRPVSDYSAGMQKKIGLACAMIHAPEVLVLDEPFEAIDPVSASNVTEILEQYVSGGGSVVMSSHSLDLIQRVCDHVAVIVDGSVIAQGTVDEVRAGMSLEERFRHLTETAEAGKGLEWLHGSSSSD